MLQQALALLKKELSKLELKPYPTGPKYPDHESHRASVAADFVQDQSAFLSGPAFQPSPSAASYGLPEFDFSDVQIDPTIFEAFSTLEPISVQVGALEENW